MKKIVCFLLFSLMAASVVTGSGILADNAMAATSGCAESFLGFKPWFEGLLDDSCNVKTPTEEELPGFVWTIVLNVFYDIMLVVGAVAIGVIIYGGYLFITAEGDPSKAAKAKKVLSAAVIGLVIAVLATIIVNTITGVLLSGS